MQQQICPRCKFRLTTAKAICNTCGFSLHNTRKPSDLPPVTAPKPVHQSPKQVSNLSSSGSAAANVRKVQSNAQSGGGGSFWRTFFGLDPLPSDKGEREERALGET
ncbi:MAG: hypothetical protein K2X27_22705 [Candidatus Obscuribacterales bacterium]|nr:hypothetical protein [Candidatus Obscuribacterales bacterium]